MRLAVLGIGFAAMLSAQAPPPAQVGALAPANLNKERPKPAFDITGTWLHGDGKPNNPFQFAAPADAKFTPAAQVHVDASRKARAEGKTYHDDIGQCWPAGMPMIMTRVWPIAMVQKATAIYMISGFMNELRIVYTDGRPHTDPDIVIPSFSGESIGHWEGDTLVVDTKYFVSDHHWVDNGIPASDEFHIVERMKLINNGAGLEIAYTLDDPKSWVGEWKMTKRWRRVDDQDITEAACLPDLNEHMPSTKGNANVR